LVDSTAAPVAGLALVSTWVAVEIEYVAEGIGNLDPALRLNAFQLFVASIPYRFYVLLALVFVPLTALLQRDFGPMLSAERARLHHDGPIDYPDRVASPYPTEPDPSTPARWYNAVLPIGLTVSVVVWLMYETGRRGLGAPPDSDPLLRDILGAADSSLALQYGALAGLGLASLMALAQRLLTRSQIVSAAGTGARLVLPAIAILWLASTLSRMTGNTSADGQETTEAYQYRDHRLYTGDYLQSLLAGSGSDAADAQGATSAPERRIVWLFPTIVFVVSGVVAFCTGTSWGTMGILMPSTVTLAYSLLAAEGVTSFAGDPIMLSSIGGVLSGAIFGDHCSPISDTTVLSSQSSGCDHIAHVWTQLPYALTVALVSIFLGTLPLGLGVSIWILLPLQGLSLVLLLLFAGGKAEP
jgi:Na+/H+ antiporter NhaC